MCDDIHCEDNWQVEMELSPRNLDRMKEQNYVCVGGGGGRPWRWAAEMLYLVCSLVYSPSNNFAK